MITVIDRLGRPQADQVLGMFKGLAAISELQLTCSVELYENGRERGYSITAWYDKPSDESRCVAFSEYRNSDDIVVYLGVVKDFRKDRGFVPSEEVFAAKEFFTYRDFMGAAEKIYGYLVHHKR